MQGARTGRGIARPARSAAEEGWGYPVRGVALPLVSRQGRPLSLCDGMQAQPECRAYCHGRNACGADPGVASGGVTGWPRLQARGAQRVAPGLLAVLRERETPRYV